MRGIIFVFFNLLIFSLCAQEGDSIFIKFQDKIDVSESDKEKIDLMLDFAEKQYEYNFSFAKRMVEEAVELINNQSDVNKEQLAKAFTIQAIINRREGRYPEALEFNLKAKSIYEELNDSLRGSDIMHNIGMVYRSQKLHQKAITLYKESIAIKKAINDVHGVAIGYNMMGVSYRQSKKLDSALVCYKKARELLESVNSFDDIQRVNNNMITLYRDQKKYDLAIELASKNITVSKKANRLFSLTGAYYNMSTLFKLLKEYEKSMLYADSALAVAKQENFRKRISKAYLRKSFLSHKMGDYKTAYFDYRKFNRYSDSIFNIENIKRIQASELNYKFQQEKREVELLAKEERSKKQLYRILFLLVLVSGLIIAYLIFRIYKNRAIILEEKVEREKAQKELLDAKVKVGEEETKKLVADNTMRLEFKQELLDQIKTHILPEAKDELKVKLSSLISELQLQVTTEGKLSEIQSKITDINQGFDAKLRELYPKLTKTEREVCALLRVNLSIKEIMTVRNSSLDAVKSTRYRIRKKMGLNSGEELERFIQSI
ncbi:tetratricopeptide repeat protein [Tenacibaculum sp. 190524A05c]|uniref:tetratricopeptide repeat protein n=1 Tax=Tenacibaculum platacis TaxID=3137852 RepID=UPI0032B1EF1D